MLRGAADEIKAREYYETNIAPIKPMGFIVNDDFGFKLGFSPDGLVGDDGIYEGKSRLQKYHFQTILENLEEQTSPDEFVIQQQTGLIASQRKWSEFTSFCGG